MIRKIHLLLSFMLLLTACGEQSASKAIPSYAQAAQQYQQKISDAMEKLAAEDRAVMQQSAEDLAKRLPDPGLKAGEAAPRFSLSDAYGKTVSLDALLQEGPVVLVFYRGAWCPFCNMHLAVLNQSLPQIKALGARVVAITPQRPDKSAEQLGKSGYPFTVLSDLDNRVMQAYRLYFELEPELVKVYKKLGLDLAEYNGADRYVLPVPGTFVIDSNGIVRASHATTDYTQRMEPAAIIKALQDIQG